MKNYLKSDLQGRDLIKPYFLLFIPYVVLYSISEFAIKEIISVYFVFSIFQAFIIALLTFTIGKYIICRVSFKEKSVFFEGTIKEFAPKILKWILLNIVTLGIYTPWYYKNYINYFLKRTSYAESKAKFLSEPKKLLKNMLLLLYLPLIILSTIFLFFMYKRTLYYIHNRIEDYFFGPVVLFTVACILAMLPFMFFFYKWLINVKINENFVSFDKNISETISFFLLQIFLSIITFGIYSPAMVIKSFRFLLEGSIITDENKKVQGGFEFSGKTSSGFGLLWGQGLLLFITLGIYGPWAICKISSWYINNTCIIYDSTAKTSF